MIRYDVMKLGFNDDDDDLEWVGSDEAAGLHGWVLCVGALVLVDLRK